MTIPATIQSILPSKDGKINWSLLLFLVLVLNVKLVVKVAAILLFAWLNRSSFTREIMKRKFIIFYAAMAGLGVLNLLFHLPEMKGSYLVVVCTGAGLWILGGLSAVILSAYVKNNDVQKLHATLSAFFLINAIITIMVLLWIIIDAGSINPYTYQGEYQKYFISTGDWMKGLSFDTSTTNALINAFAVVYFLTRRKFGMVILCMAILTLTGSNLSNILLIAVLLYLFTARSDRDQKSIIVMCLMILIIFLVKVSPQNNTTTLNTFRSIAGVPKPKKPVAAIYPDIRLKPDSLLNPQEKKQKHAKLYLDSVARALSAPTIAKPEPRLREINNSTGLSKPKLPRADIHSLPYQLDTTLTSQQERLLAYARQHIPGMDTNVKAIRARAIPGKLVSFRETINFLKVNPGKILMGTGMGRFSSKLAFRVTGLGISGGFPAAFIFIDEDFRQNHLNHYISYYTAHKELHSLIHTPNSVYDQLLSEYGIAGCLVFIFFYLTYFIRGLRKTGYGMPLLLLLLGALAMDYWFEQLSIIILFEFMMLVEKKENTVRHG